MATKRVVADVPEKVAIDFKIAVIKNGKKVHEAVAEALKMWTEAQEKDEDSYTQEVT